MSAARILASANSAVGDWHHSLGADVGSPLAWRRHGTISAAVS